jgi:sugar phosphate permease
MTSTSAAHNPPAPIARATLIWSLSALAFGYAFFQRVAPSVMVNDLMAEFAVSGAVLGQLSALYFYPYAAMQLPIGALLDRYGARLMLSIALLAAGAGSACSRSHRASSLPMPDGS